MKNIKILLFAVLPLAIAACSTENETIDSIDILSADSEFSATAGEGVILLSASGDNLKATTNAEWLTIQRSNSSSSVRFEVSENTSLSNRAAVITLKNGSAAREVVVYQQGAILTIPNKVTMPIKKSSVRVQYNVNLDIIPSVSIVKGSEWFSATSNDNGEIIIQTKTDNMIERQGIINVRTAWSSINITVTQLGFIDKTSVYLFNGSLFFSDVIELNQEVVDALELSGQEDWYEAKIIGTDLKITALEPNNGTETRTSNLVLTYGDISATILVAQENSIFYEYLKGTWEMLYMNNLRKKTVRIRMSDKEGLEDVMVLSIAPGNQELNSPLVFDETTGKLSLAPCEVARFNVSGNPLYITLYNSGNSYITKREDVSVDLIFNRDYNNPQLLFKDNGSWSTQIADGLVFAEYTINVDLLEYEDYYAVYPYVTAFAKGTE